MLSNTDTDTAAAYTTYVNPDAVDYCRELSTGALSDRMLAFAGKVVLRGCSGGRMGVINGLVQVVTEGAAAPADTSDEAKATMHRYRRMLPEAHKLQALAAATMQAQA